MGNFLRADFWFSLRPGVFDGLTLKIIIGLISLFIILAIAAGVIKKRWNKSLYAAFWSSSYSFFLTNAVIGLVLLFFNYEMVPFLSARFWFAIWLVSLLVWLYFIYKKAAAIPGRKARLEKEREFKKYLP